jgi:hypothetical protein
LTLNAGEWVSGKGPSFRQRPESRKNAGLDSRIRGDDELFNAPLEALELLKNSVHQFSAI